MSKIICDVCGTAFAESADQCPICGTARTDAARSGGAEGEAGYAYVKGGRFSQSNVRKHNNGQKDLPRATATEKAASKPKKEVAAEKSARAAKPKRQDPEDAQPSNLGLIIIVVILLLAIIAACAYIGIKVSNIFDNRNNSTNPSGSITEPVDVPCDGITIAGPTSYTITGLNDSCQISVTCTPANTTDSVEWEYDESIVTVTQSGSSWLITPVAPGETTVTARCGEFEASIQVICDFTVEEPTDPTDPTDPDPTDPTNPTDPNFVLEWACNSDITLNGYGTSWRIYNGSVDVNDITFTSSNEEIATVKDGRVYIWDNGVVTITATYGDQTITMIVRARNVEKPEEGKPDCKIYTQYGTSGTDFTIRVGETLTLHLRDADGVKLTDVTFSVQDESIITVNENGVVTAVDVATTGVYVYIEYQGYTYKCLIRVYPAVESGE